MFVIPMVGLSSRFFKAGYQVPKYQLQLGDVSVFESVVSSFAEYFLSDKFLFICRPDFDTPEFIKIKAQSLGIYDYEIVVLDHPTSGQAETVALALSSFYDQPIYIFNIDTIHNSFNKKTTFEMCDGYLEVFEGEGDHWSFVKPGQDFSVLETTEKNRISNLCSNGLYYFKSSKLFCHIFQRRKAADMKQAGEYYIAPMYNDLIAMGCSVKYKLVKFADMGLCGTPAEYENFKNCLSDQTRN